MNVLISDTFVTYNVVLDDTVEAAKHTKYPDVEIYSNTYDDHLNLYALPDMYALPDTAQYYETVSLVWLPMCDVAMTLLCSLYLKELKPVEDMSLLRFD